jgi:catecholate siderophore receptor
MRRTIGFARPRRRARPAVTTRWVAAGALAGWTLFFDRAPALAADRLRHDGALAGTEAAAASGQPVLRYDIPPGPLGGAIDAFEATAGVQVVVPLETIRDLQSHGVAGVYTAEQALEKLLDGTHVSHRWNGPASVTLQLRRSELVEVTAPVLTPSSPKYTEPLRDIPQTVIVIPSGIIEQQGATTLRDVLQNVPGLTIAAGEGGTPAGDNLTLRGFSARNDVFVDGVRDLGPQSRDPFDLEQVDVVMGPGSAYTGRGSTGGTVNLVSKSPHVGSAYAGALTFGTDATRRLTADVNQPITPLGRGTVLRLNVMGHDADVAGRNAVTSRQLTLSYYHLEQDNLSDYGIPWVPADNTALVDYRDQPAPVPRDTFYGYKSRDHEELGADLGTARYEQQLDARWRISSQLRYGHSTRDSIATPPRFASADSTLINREMRSWLTRDDIWDEQTDLRGELRSGAVEHTLVAGIALSWERNQRWTRTAPGSQTTLFDPNPDAVYEGAITQSPVVGDMSATSLAAYVFDTAKLGPKLELTGGLRYDYFDASGTNTNGDPLARIDDLLSFRAGAVWKPRANGSVYVGAGTSLNPSLEGLTYGGSSTDASLEPEKTYTVQVGSKWDLARGRLGLSAALFRVEKTNARTPGLLPDDPPMVLEGRQRVSGVELGLAGSLTRCWQLFAAFTHLRSAIVESNNPAEVGNELPQTPPNALSVWTSYRLGSRLELGVGTRFMDRRYNSTANVRSVDGYWVLDAMASLRLTRRLELKLNAYNLTDTYYFDRVGGGHVVPGPARSALLGASVKF